jgi:hypothetical protein
MKMNKLKNSKGQFIKTDPVERFNSSIEKTESCWIWKGKLDKGGYGSFWVNGKTMRAHRYSYELFKNVIDLNNVIMHTCDNPSCVNPEHLKEGTTLDNVNDKVDKKRHAIGSKIGTSKLSEEQVIEIKKLLSKEDRLSYNKIANIFNVHKSLIYLIHKNKSWKHI